MRDKLPDVGDIIGMRNRIAHGYSDVSYPVLWDTAVDKVPGMCANIERFLQRSRSSDLYGASKPISAWVPSQNGLFFDWPQRQRVTRLRTS